MGDVGKKAGKPHLCELMEKKEFGTVKRLARGAVFICRECGRSARDPGRLCRPESL